MSKKLTTILSAMLVLVMCASLAACGGSAPATSAPAASTAETPAPSAAAPAAPADNASGSMPNVMFATHEVGTSNYNLSAELSKLWEENGAAVVDVQPISPGGMGAPYLFQQDKCDLTFINGAPAKWAAETGTLGKEPTGGYMAMVGGLTNVSAVNFMTKAFSDKYGVTTIEEALRQKLPIRIGCSPVGSMDNEVVLQLFECLGVTEDDIVSWGGSITRGGGSDLATMVKDGKLDYMLDHTSPSSSTMVEIAMTADVIFMQWEDSTIEWFVKEKGFQRVTLPANSFKGQTNAITNPGTPDCIFVREGLEEDTVYALTKVMCENRDKIVASLGSVEPFDPATCWEPEKVAGIKLHPGAERYFKEAGYIK